MTQKIIHLTLVVKDYDEAIDFYTKKLDFDLLENTTMSETKRWVLVAPKGTQGCTLLLAKAANTEQLQAVGNQTGGRVFLFLETDDFWRDFNNYTAKGVNFVREPIEEVYGTVAVFADLYGNTWDLIQKK